MLKNDLKINILLNTKAPTIKSFGRSLIFSKRAAQGAPAGLIGVSRVYTEATEMLADGYTVNDAEYKAAVKYQSQEIKSADFVVFTGDSANAEEVSLNSAKAQIDFYGLLHTSRVLVDLHAAGDWALANEKLFIGGTDDTTIGASRNNIREAYFLHTDNTLFADFGIAGLCFPQNIGDITWKWQEPAGMIATSFTPTQINTIATNKTQTFEQLGSYVMSNDGVTTGGQFIDIIMIRDLVQARLFEDSLMKFRGGKLSLDDLGSMDYEAVLRARFDYFGRSGIIPEVKTEAQMLKSDMGKYQYKLNMPVIDNIPLADKAARKMSGISFSFVAAGKMHSVEINGEINV